MNDGGSLNYARLAQANRPTDPARLTEEVKRLSAQGLTSQDISVALRIGLGQVKEMLAASGEEAARLHSEAWQR